jgi:hypothetical protein
MWIDGRGERLGRLDGCEEEEEEEEGRRLIIKMKESS